MRLLKQIGCATLSAVVVLGCSSEEAPPATTSTTQTLLAQPRAADMSNTFDAGQLSGGEPILSIDELGVNMGSEEAPVKVIEFVDFGCGFCRQFQLQTFDSIRVEFIETNMLEWKFMPFVSGSFTNSLAVTEAAECALNQDVRLFEVFETRLWAEQSEWKSSSEPEGLVRGWITQMGGDGAAYDSCMQDDEKLERVRSSTAVAAQLGVRSTPTFWIVGAGPVQGALPMSVFRELFTQMHAELTASAG